MVEENGGGPRGDDLYDEVERRALMGLPAEDGEDDAPNLLDALRPDGADEQRAEDLTLGGYIQKHDRAPAFEGSDGQPYTVAVDTDKTDDAARPFAAFLIFIRWAATGAGIMDHCESGDITFGQTEEEAARAALELSLYEVRAELDAAIERKRTDISG